MCLQRICRSRGNLQPYRAPWQTKAPRTRPTSTESQCLMSTFATRRLLWHFPSHLEKHTFNLTTAWCLYVAFPRRCLYTFSRHPAVWINEGCVSILASPWSVQSLHRGGFWLSAHHWAYLPPSSRRGVWWWGKLSRNGEADQTGDSA